MARTPSARISPPAVPRLDASAAATHHAPIGRLPFDPERALGGERPAETAPTRSAAEAAPPLSVSEACGLIRTALERHLPPSIRVIGEVSGLSQRNHWYFTLKDSGAVLSCAAWATTVRRFGFVPREGEEVIATGAITHYAPQGRTQFVVTDLKPVGMGELAIRFKALCDELRRLGYFEQSRKKPLPFFPRRIAVLTSRTGAAIHDVIDTARRRNPATELLLVDVRVQGDGAAEQIARAIRFLDASRERLALDAILVTRGGGSIEDLWAFNERIVADAVFACRLPLVAAIGHESDTTIIELVADVRAATPTQAVMRLVPDASELRRQLDDLRGRMILLESRLIASARRRVELIARHEFFRRPESIIDRQRDRLAGLRRRGPLALRALLGRRRHQIDRAATILEQIRPAPRIAAARAESLDDAARLQRAVLSRVRVLSAVLDGLRGRLDAVDPRRVLARGYSMTTLEDGRVLRAATEAPRGTRITTRLAEGAITSVVSDSSPASREATGGVAPEGAVPRGVATEGGATAVSAAARSTPSRNRASRPATESSADQLDLFRTEG